MMQTWAIFVDAYRELNSKKLFWIVLLLSGLVVAIYALIGINEKGLTFFIWDLGIPPTSGMVPPEVFYKSLFTGLGIQFWLAWIATILALISTAGIFVDLITSGSIELTLSKPISRLRLFATKYVGGMLFVALQVAVFTAACFIVLGVRGGAWEPGLFWAVPLVLLFFSYLFSICVLLGLLTRSTVASLLLTLLIWLMIFGLHVGEYSLLMAREYQDAKVERIEEDIAKLRTALDSPGELADERPNLIEAWSEPIRRANWEQRLRTREEQLESSEKLRRTWGRTHMAAYGIKTVLPKTSETIALLERVLIAEAELEAIEGAAEQDDEFATILEQGARADEVAVSQEEIADRMQDETRGRSVAWIIGTSVAFELVMLGLGAWIFCRRDF